MMNTLSRELTNAVSLYVDDVVIFYHPDEADLRAVRGILEVFGEAGCAPTSQNARYPRLHARRR
jgi:hypothetical protein